MARDPAAAAVKVEDVGLASISLSARIPEFWTDQPRVWFIQLEAILAPQKLGDTAKFHIIISKLGKDVIQQVTDILVSPPEEHKYEKLKSRLLEIYEESENRQIQKLIGEMELGDQKPTQLLRKMQDLARSKISEETLSILWQNHLPASVRGVLAATETTNVERLANIADRVMENSRPIQVAEVMGRPAVTDDPVLAEIAKLSDRVANIERSSRFSNRRGRDASRYRSQSRPRSSSRGRRTPDSPDWLCFYHYRFKGKATKCVQPCSWKHQEN